MKKIKFFLKENPLLIFLILLLLYLFILLFLPLNIENNDNIGYFLAIGGIAGAMLISRNILLSKRKTYTLTFLILLLGYILYPFIKKQNITLHKLPTYLFLSFSTLLIAEASNRI